MAVFERLPAQIRRAVEERISQDEEIKMCFLGGSSLFASRDYVVITSRRALVMDERTIGCLGRSYVNIKEDVPIDQISEVEITRTFMNKLLGQSSMGLQIEGYKYLINNGDKKEIQAAADLISSLAHLTASEAN
jgi:hypothetical protein